MFSRLQAAIPVFTDEDRIDHWVKKIFPWRQEGKKDSRDFPDQREYYRLGLEHFPPLDAALVFRDGSVTDLLPLNLSASGLCAKTSTALPLFEGQFLRLIFVLPLEEAVVLNTEARLVAREHGLLPGSWVLHLQFSEKTDDPQRELIHRYIIKKQFEKIKHNQGWRFS